ncbi:hypothetical protein STSP2_00179 [Anaerohalosphaera lusitana]|uniref:Uncharacterized protein n=1 Tax=Anaerohalosphaera lusitana TaxID=1936003 RepID=A0A1U9NHF2_9BACT|nr:hypothetical protein [Anaerohalosphaera lusitana]AQT67040.1 hypothetical protein STSP2_00179 [Anaerohalosphaera lusitana]
MKYRLLTVALCMVIFSGCVRSLHPFGTEEDIIYDPNLIGCWQEEGEEETWCFEKGKIEKSYILYMRGDGETIGPFGVHLLKIKGEMFIDMLPCGPEFDMDNPYEFQTLPVHVFAHVKQIEPALQMRFPDPDWFKRLIEDNPKALKHEIVNGEPLVTASTKQMQEFWLKHLETKDAFSKTSNKRKLEKTKPDNIEAKSESNKKGMKKT